MSWIRLCSLAFLLAPLLPADSSNVLKDFYSTMIAPGGPVPEFPNGLSTMERIETETKANLQEALPVVAQSLRHKNPQVLIWGVYAVGVIAMRTDGEDLLTPYVERLGEVLSETSDARVQTGLLVTLARFHPVVVAKVRPQLLKVLQTGSGQIKAGVVHVLLKSDPNSPDVLEALAAYAKEPLDVTSRAQLITQLGIPGIRYPALLKICQDGLSDPDPNIKIASIHAIRRIGPAAIAAARERLLKITGVSSDFEGDFR